MALESKIVCGPFELLEPRGSGSVAVVWRARHRTRGVAAAVKVIVKEKARSGDYQERFRSEVRSHARLNHPAIVTVFDYGEIGKAAEATSSGELVAGSPYLAMEYTEGGALGKSRRVRSWFQLRSVLLQVLDGLAHAHARRVVHRDLKPDNILWFPDRDGGRFKISDFGIAHAFSKLVGVETQDIRDAIAGTPYYMPPEQLSGEWRQVGPWSDLYALGCVAFELVTGQRPYAGGNLAEVAGQKFAGHVPEMEPRFPVPAEVEGWIARLLSKKPRDRFRRAADAAWALRRLPARAPASEESVGGLDEDTDVEGGRADEEETDVLLTTMRIDESDADLQRATPVSDTKRIGEAEGTEEADGPPFPHDWSIGGGSRQTHRPVDVGLRLFGVREIPFVDRDSERNVIWNALSDVASGGGVQVIEIRGPSGAGKSRLAEWMARRADELGVATWLRATHSRRGDRSEGLSAMIETELKAWKLERRRMFERIREALEEMAGWAGKSVHDGRLDNEARALTEFVHPTTGGDPDVDGPQFRFSSAPERFDAVARFLERFGWERPVVMWMDDVQWGADALGLIEHLLDRRQDLPVLALLTVQSDAIEEEVVYSQLQRLARRDRYRRLSIGSLSVRDQAELINEVLPLDSQIAQTVLQRTGGLPLFIIQLLSDWVDSDRLALKKEGYTIDDNRLRTDPGTLQDIWDRRIDSIVRRVGGHDTEPIEVSLELAAILGTPVEQREWRAACRLAGVSPRPQLVDELVREGLVWPREHRWEFVHGRLAESLRENARAAGRWRGHHGICADALASLYNNAGIDVQERRVEHLLSAGRLGDALAPMLEIADYLYTLERYRDVERILDRRRAVTDSLELGANDRRWIENLEMRARIERVAGNREECAKLVERVIRVASDRRWEKVLGFAYITRAVLEHEYGELGAGLQSLQRAKRHLESCDNVLGLARVHRERATILRRRAEFERARREYEAAIELYTDFGFEAARIDLENFIGYTWVAQNHLEKAEGHFQTALDQARRIGSATKEAGCWNRLGDVSRYRGEWQEAHVRYRRAFEMSGGDDNPQSDTVRINLVLVAIGSGDVEEAERQLHRCQERFGYAEPVFELARLCIAGFRGEWERWDQASERVDALLAEAEGVETDAAWLSQRAGEIAAAAGAVPRARAAFDVGRDLWRKLGVDSKVDACTRRMRQIATTEH